jgi:uncharacterized protein
MLHPAIVMQSKGTIHGRGLFAIKPLKKGTLLWQLDEPTYTLEEIKTWSAERYKAFRRYGFQCGIDRYSLPEGLSRETNHSCDPNTWWADSGTIVARRDILRGEEITYDYATADIDIAFEMACRCGARNCRRKVTNLDYLDPDWQAQYGSNLPAHVLDAIENARIEGD